MAADPSSLVLAEPWRKGTRSGSGGCVEAARLAHVAFWPADTAALPYATTVNDGRPLGQATAEGASSLI
jgi:Domain of unknown function (DUF397)